MASRARARVSARPRATSARSRRSGPSSGRAGSAVMVGRPGNGSEEAAGDGGGEHVEIDRLAVPCPKQHAQRDDAGAGSGERQGGYEPHEPNIAHRAANCAFLLLPALLRGGGVRAAWVPAGGGGAATPSVWLILSPASKGERTKTAGSGTMQ